MQRAYRAFADFSSGGEVTTLAGDLVVQKVESAHTASTSAPNPNRTIKAIRGTNSHHDDWDAVVCRAMLDAYDADGSGELDSEAELVAIPCKVWRAIDSGVKSAWSGTGARAIYGFAAGYGWVGGSFGFSESLRASADKSMQTCGLKD